LASLVDLENDEAKLASFQRALGEELERLKDVRLPEAKSRIIKKLQLQMFETALSLSFNSVREH
jgi:hypothetical protein